jgi:hypothetical protein
MCLGGVHPTQRLRLRLLLRLRLRLLLKWPLLLPFNSR